MKLQQLQIFQNLTEEELEKSPLKVVYSYYPGKNYIYYEGKN